MKLFRRKDVDVDPEGPVTHRYAVLGAQGAVDFQYIDMTATGFTNPFMSRLYLTLKSGIIILPYDLGWHSPKPTYKGEESTGGCYLLEGDCYYEGSQVSAHTIAESWIDSDENDEEIWQRLETNYRMTLGLMKESE